MKLGIEMNISMPLALTWICFREWLISNRKYKDVINEIMTMAKEVRQLEYTDQHTYKRFHKCTLEKLELSGVLSSYDYF